MEEPLTVPAVIRLGGNAEERAIAILERAQPEIPAPLEAYGKDDTPDFCAERLQALVQDYTVPDPLPAPKLTQPMPEKPYSFQTVTNGTITFDHALCADCESKVCIESCVPQILSLEDGLPVLNIDPEEAQKGRCIECLACEIECSFEGNKGGYIHLPIKGLDHFRKQTAQTGSGRG
jgi:succinyl-CoA synthetase beta subunit